MRKISLFLSKFYQNIPEKNYFSGSAIKSTSLSAAVIKLLSKQGNKIFKTYKCQRSNFNECQAISGSELLGRCEGIKLFSFRWSCFPEICLQLANSIQFVNTIEYYWCHLHTYTWSKYWWYFCQIKTIHWFRNNFWEIFNICRKRKLVAWSCVGPRGSFLVREWRRGDYLYTGYHSRSIKQGIVLREQLNSDFWRGNFMWRRLSSVRYSVILWHCR